MLDPGLRSIKCGERAGRFYAVAKFGIHPRSLEAFEVTREVRYALIARLSAGVKAKVRAHAASALREQNGELSKAVIEYNLAGVLGRSNVVQQEADDQQVFGVAAKLKTR